jgi:hypothetical protein
MNRILILLLTIVSFQANAQINELGIFAGGSNHIGDIGPTTYIAPKDLALGVIYKWNRSPRHAYRASFTYAKISSKDADSNVPGRKQRGLEFENTIKELSVGMEFNFFDFNLHEPDFKITPYVHTGISYFWYDDKYFNNGVLHTNDTKGTLAIPMTVGIKSNILENFILGFEVGTRYSFTDNLDGTNPEGDTGEILSFGNKNSKDWYVFTGFTLTYTFGVKPCYCSE